MSIYELGVGRTKGVSGLNRAHIVRKAEIRGIVLNLHLHFLLVYEIQYLCPEKIYYFE